MIGAAGLPASITSQAAHNGTGRVAVKVTEHGHKIQRTQLFLRKLQLAEAAGNALEYSGPLPRG